MLISAQMALTSLISESVNQIFARMSGMLDLSRDAYTGMLDRVGLVLVRYLATSGVSYYGTP